MEGLDDVIDAATGSEKLRRFSIFHCYIVVLEIAIFLLWMNSCD